MPMPPEFRRTLRLLPLEITVRWHAWRATRHHDRRAIHLAALDRDMDACRLIAEHR